MDKIIQVIVILATMLAIGLASYEMGYDTADIKPTKDLFWIDDMRLHKDSTITVSAIYSDMNEQIGSYIRVDYNGAMTYVECLNEKGYTYQDFRDSWIMAFKEGVKGVD